MDLSLFNFAQPNWLWLGLCIPIFWGAFFLFRRRDRSNQKLETFIDAHLIPHLLIESAKKPSSLWKALALWSVVWTLMTFAMAGPRWDYKEIETFSRDQSLVVLLDLSQSMDAVDVKPSRLTRAKQKIDDLIQMSKGVKMGLVAYAADPHLISPITEDKQVIRHMLPSLSTDLVFIQGSRLIPALEMASSMLEAEPGHNKSILLISDGGFEDGAAISTVKKLSEKGISVHTMGVGLVEGIPLKDSKGNIIKKAGSAVFSKLEKEKLTQVADSGLGRYLEAQYSSESETLLLKDLEKKAEAQAIVGQKSRLWDERFYLLLIVPMGAFLYWFRRGYVLCLVLIFAYPFQEVEAGTFKESLQNSEQKGQRYLEEGDFASAIDSFQDAYRKGIAYYNLGDYGSAEKMFSQSKREEVASSASYNLGNALAQQQKYQEAIKAYEKALEKDPKHSKAKDNLTLVKNILQEQESKSEGSGSDESGQKEKDEGDESTDGSSKSSDSEESESQQDPQSSDTDESQESKESSSEENPEDRGSEEQKEQESSNQDLNEPSEEELKGSEEAEEDQSSEAPEEPANPHSVQQCKTQEDLDADAWLNQLSNDPKAFLKNKFYLESKKNGTTKGTDPW